MCSSDLLGIDGGTERSTVALVALHITTTAFRETCNGMTGLLLNSGNAILDAVLVAVDGTPDDVDEAALGGTHIDSVDDAVVVGVLGASRLALIKGMDNRTRIVGVVGAVGGTVALVDAIKDSVLTIGREDTV